MPIYEYKCKACEALTSVLVQGFRDPENLVCEQCGATELVKIISKINYHGSQGDRLSSYDPRQPKGDAYYRDTRNIGLDAEHMLKRAGVEPTDDFKAKLEKVRTDPSSVIKDHKS